MSPKLIKKSWLIATAIAAMVAIWAAITVWATYPIRVTFSFNYDGKPVEMSYLTTMTAGLGNFLEISLIRYTHGKDRTSYALPDGSLVILQPDWAEEWESYKPGRVYRSSARWLWQDDVKTPKQLVYGDRTTHHVVARTGSPPFTWLNATAKIERLSRLHLLAAIRSDNSTDDDDLVKYANMLGGSAFAAGTLFAEPAVQPIQAKDPASQEKIDQLKAAPDWISASENCRFKSLGRDDARIVFGLTSFQERILPLRTGDAWTVDGGPRPGEPIVMHTTGTQIPARPPSPSFSIAPFRHQAVDMVHVLKWGGAICSGIQAPEDAQWVLVEFADGRLLLVTPSDFVAIVDE